MSVVKRGRPYPAFGVLQRNLNVLFERVPHGDKRVIAAQLGVAPLTETLLARYRASARILRLNDAHLAAVLRLLAELEPHESAAVTDH